MIDDSGEFVGAVWEDAFLAPVYMAISKENTDHSEAAVGDSTPIDYRTFQQLVLCSSEVEVG